MHNKLCILIAFFVAAISACKKDEHKIYFEGGTAPVLSSDVSTAIPLSFATAANEALALSWTNPDFHFTTGISSQDVTYTLEIDTTGADFTNPSKAQIVITKDLQKVFLQSELNDLLLNQLRLDSVMQHQLDIRVTASIGTTGATLSSNILQFTAAPYSIPPKVEPPASGELYITGNATGSDWTNSPPTAQKFTRLSRTLYELTVHLTGGNSYTFLPTYGSWDDKYSIAVKNDPNEIYGGDFQWQGNDILAPPATGDYKIQVDFQRGKFTVTKL